MRRITVFCASSTQVPEVYKDAARELGACLAASGMHVVYGGGSLGLMGELADSVLAAGGSITGIIPRFMLEVEWGHGGLTELQVVETMHQRKEQCLNGTDAVIALPGGCGTLEELMEAITLKRLGLFTKPILILNINGFFDPLFELLDRMIGQRFLRPEHRNIWSVVNTTGEIAGALKNAPSWDASARSFAAL